MRSAAGEVRSRPTRSLVTSVQLLIAIQSRVPATVSAKVVIFSSAVPGTLGVARLDGARDRQVP